MQGSILSCFKSDMKTTVMLVFWSVFHLSHSGSCVLVAARHTRLKPSFVSPGGEPIVRQSLIKRNQECNHLVISV
jgi:hypothetical protein